MKWLVSPAIICMAATFALADDSKLPPAIKTAQSQFTKAMEKAKAERDVKVELADKELEQRSQEAKKSYLKQLDDALLAETKKGNLDGANAIKAERDRIAGGDASKPTAQELKIAPKMDSEKSIRTAFDLQGNWRIERGGLFLATGATLAGTQELVGDFSLAMTATVAIETGQYFRIAISACGETFTITNSGAMVIRLDRKGDRLTMRLGNQPVKQLVIKEANKDAPFQIRVHCVPNGNFPGKSEMLIHTLSLAGKLARPE